MPPGTIPWGAFAIGPVATLGDSGFRDGPVHRTGTTPSSPQVATTSSPPVIALMLAVLGSSEFAMLANQAFTLTVFLHSGRVSLMLEYLIRVGSCHTKDLLPSSSRCSRTTST